MNPIFSFVPDRLFRPRESIARGLFGPGRCIDFGVAQLDAIRGEPRVSRKVVVVLLLKPSTLFAEVIELDETVLNEKGITRARART